VDIALLPESFNGCGGSPLFSCVQRLDGSSGRLLSSMAKKWGMYVTGTFYAWGDTSDTSDIAYNSAPFYNRDGVLMGVHNKNELYDPEADEGVTPGMDGFPVFQTDVGRVGIMTCYESWFPETARLLGYRGAEIILFPSAGYDPTLMPARAADNGVWLVAATHQDNPEGSANVWDSAGNIGGMPIDTDKGAGSSILAFKRDNETKTVYATLDLSFQWSPDWNGGDMSSAPGGRRARFTGIQDIEQQVADAAHQWWSSQP